MEFYWIWNLILKFGNCEMSEGNLPLKKFDVK